MLFNKTTEINKVKNLVLEIVRFCAEMTTQKRLYFTQTKLKENVKKENKEEFKTFSIEILFLTFSKKEKEELIKNAFKIHPKINGAIIFKKRRDKKLSLEKIDLSITTDLKENLISSFFFSTDFTLTEKDRYSLWMSEDKKELFFDFIVSIANYN